MSNQQIQAFEDPMGAADESRPRLNKIIVSDSSPIAYLMDTARFEHCCRIATLMANASLIPDHLRMNTKTKEPLPFEQIRANCFLVVNQALRWEMDPFAVAPETYTVGGKLAYQGKLVMAVINARANLSQRLDYEFSGEKGKDNFTVTVSGVLKDETKVRKVDLSVGDAKTDNQMWRKDPEQKLIYSGVVKWARRYCPEIVLGIMVEGEVIDVQATELEPRNVTPQPKPAAAFASGAKAAANTPEAAAPAERPSREEVGNTIRAAIKAAKIKNTEAAKIFQDAGLLKGELKDATDDELHVIAGRLDLLVKQAEAGGKDAASETPGPQNAAPEESGTPAAEGKTSAQRKDEALATIDAALAEGFAEPIKRADFVEMCRRQKLMRTTDTLLGLEIGKLENIAGSVTHIVETHRKEEEGA